MADPSPQRKYIKIGLITIGIISLLVLPIIFAKTQRNHSQKVYVESLAALQASGFPIDSSAYIASEMAARPAIDFGRQDRLWDLLKAAEAWDQLGSYVSFKIEAPITLDSRQLAWLNDSRHKADAEKLSALLAEGHLDKSMLAWLAQRYPKPQEFDFFTIWVDVTPNLLTIRYYSNYLQLASINNLDPSDLLKWRALNTRSDSLIGGMINVAALKEIDAALAYYAWLGSSPKMSLSIIEANNAFKQCLIGEVLFFGNSSVKLLNESQWFDLQKYTGHDNPIDNICVYIWGHLDCAAYNDYHRNIFASLNEALPTPIKDISIETQTSLGRIFLPNMVESLYVLYASNSHQRLCQLSIDLSHYYRQHGSLPKDAAELQALLPASYALLAGGRFRIALTYKRPTATSYFLEVDSSHLPDSLPSSRIKKAPAIGKHIFMVDDHYLFAEMDYPAVRSDTTVDE